jgi:hypothetical protein
MSVLTELMNDRQAWSRQHRANLVRTNLLKVLETLSVVAIGYLTYLFHREIMAFGQTLLNQ